MIDSPTPSPQPSQKPLKLLVIGMAVVTLLAVGIAIGLWWQLQSLSEQVVQVVVTATPDLNRQNLTKTQAESKLPEPQSAGETSRSDGKPATVETTSNSPTADQAAPTPTIMDFLLSDARHMEGSPDAPVTLIEFSDFK